MRIAIFIYEPQQIDHLDQLISADGTSTIIACNAEVEFLLERKNVAFRSLQEFTLTPVSDRLIHAGKIVPAILHNKAFSFFKYRDVDLRNLFTPTLKFYLGVFLYYLDIVISVLEEDSYDQISIMSSVAEASPTGGILHIFDLRMMVDAVRLVCSEKKIKLVVQEFSTYEKKRIFGVKRMVFGWGMAALNTVVALFVRPKKILILASENWKNIAPLMNELPESELFLLDRTESLKAGWKAILHNRMRFVHSNNFLTSRAKCAAKTKAGEFLHSWETNTDRSLAFSDASFRGYALQPQLKDVINRILVVGGEKAAQDIEGIYALCAYAKPKLVIVRAGVSAQTHFAILCNVASALGIPSLEIQHGTLYFGPESYSTERAAEYIAEYGPQMRRDLKTIGYDDVHLFDVGSPRFDTYKEMLPVSVGPSGVFRVMCISPRVAPGFWTDSYDVFSFYKSVAMAVEGIPNVHVIIKLRPVTTGETFYREAIARAFGDIPHTIAQYESIADLFAKTDVIVSCYSTVLIESLLSGRPTIYFSAGIATYRILANSGENAAAIEAGAILWVDTSQELHETLKKISTDSQTSVRIVAAADSFMKGQYSFDGKSAERLADVVRKLAKKP